MSSRAVQEVAYAKKEKMIVLKYLLELMGLRRKLSAMQKIIDIIFE